MTTQVDGRAPPLFWTLTEARAWFELGSFGLLRQAMTKLPKGDGHSVLVLPGFLATDKSTRPMRGLLNDLGYNTHGWSLGRNLKFDDVRERELNELVTRVYQKQGRKISIVGWSLGGVFARELAKMHPEKVRSVISLGSPITNNRRYSSARHLFEAINGKETRPESEGRYGDLAAAPPVPTTSIFTKWDGIVNWRGSIQHPEPGADTENIVVPSSHVGLGVSPLVMVAIADRLSQAEGEWMPFERSGWREFVYKGTPQTA
ncbi:MAG: alpha/beta fold hydrolase [Pseudomonadota bacterium]